MSHQCPGPRCKHDDVPDEMLACSGHWYQVPVATRKAVWRAWRNGDGAGTREHRAAITHAIATMRPFRKDVPDES